MADDLSVVNSARVSFGKHKSELDDTDVGLITFLMRERHGTPFEHNAFRFHVRCPIFVAREWFRHRVGSFNEFSARYTEMPDDAYQPAAEYWRTQVGKPGSYRFEPLDEIDALFADSLFREAYGAAFNAYREMLGRGVAKEVARMVLPVGVYTEFFWTVNARSLMNFLSLRTHEAAQREIRDYAVVVESLFAGEMPVTYEAWKSLGRVAP
jgi:thymidylate synthase (FAD)